MQSLDEFFEQLEDEKTEADFQKRIDLGKSVARKHGWNFGKFKTCIQQLYPALKKSKTEDEWVWDYHSWLFALNIIFESPEEWAKEYYS